MTDKVVLVLSGKGANDAIRGQMAEYGGALESMGLSVVHIVQDQAELQYAVDLVCAGQVRFAFTWLGIGQDLMVAASGDQEGRNLWEALGVPLVKFHGDIPAYFIDYHVDVPRNAVNLYDAVEFMYFRRRWLPRARALSTVISGLPISPLPRQGVDAALRRRGKLVFLKNGDSPTELRQLWQERLPRSIARLVADMADAITPIGLRPGLLHIGDFVASCLEDRRVDPDSAGGLVPFFTAQLDDYLRRVKSRMIAESILDLPVVVQGSFWQHVDFTGRRAQLVEGQDYEASRHVYLDQLGVIDMSPNVDTAPHERVLRAAGSFATILTNRQGWLASQFPGCEELTFEFTPDSIRARVSDAIAHPDKYLDLGIAFGERFRELYTREAFAQRVVEMADLAALQWSPQKPFIQPFFVWPRK